MKTRIKEILITFEKEIPRAKLFCISIERGGSKYCSFLANPSKYWYSGCNVEQSRIVMDEMELVSKTYSGKKIDYRWKRYT